MTLMLLNLAQTRGASGRKTKIKEDTTGFYRDPEKVSDHSS